MKALTDTKQLFQKSVKNANTKRKENKSKAI